MSLIELQRSIFLRTLKELSGNEWKLLIVDKESRSLLYNVAKEDDILNAHIVNIEQLESRRQPQHELDAIYLLAPRPHIFQILENDLDRRRYRRAFLVWLSEPPRRMAEVLFRSESRRALIAHTRSLDIDFFPTESHLVSFREPWSFPVLYHPDCEQLFAEHLHNHAQRIVSLCISLGEFPIVKFYQTRADYATNNACYNIADTVHKALDRYAQNSRNNFPPPSPRPRSVLIITDRTMDLMSPLIHELTYQAMAMDLLPMKDDGDKLIYHNVIRKGAPDQEEKDVEITESDSIWVENRHLHMKDLLVKLSNDFKKFMTKNSHFADTDGSTVSVSTIKSMLAGLPEFQEGKDAFSLHIDMAEKCSEIFQKGCLLDATLVEQCLATGLDEDNRRPKNLAESVIRLLDPKGPFYPDAEEPNKPPLEPMARMRLLVMYVLFRNGILEGDVAKLLQHAELLNPSSRGRTGLDEEPLKGLERFGLKPLRKLGDQSSSEAPLFPAKVQRYAPGEEVSLSRYEPVVKRVLEAYCAGELDGGLFRNYDRTVDDGSLTAAQQTSLRNAQPTWTKGRNTAVKPKQRIIVFMAGGATYGESRACYEISQEKKKEVYLVTDHLLTPRMFLYQLRTVGASHLAGSPIPRPPPPPEWLNDAPAGLPSGPKGLPSGPKDGGPRPPVQEMHKMSLSSHKDGATPARTPGPPSQSASVSQDDGKLKKDKKDKKHGFGGMFKKH